MARLDAKIDSNQPEIVDTLRLYPGVTVESIARMGKGKPDILVGYRGNSYMFEIKQPKKRMALTDDEKKFRACWTGHYDVVISADEILYVLGIECRLDESQVTEFLAFRDHVFPPPEMLRQKTLMR